MLDFIGLNLFSRDWRSLVTWTGCREWMITTPKRCITQLVFPRNQATIFEAKVSSEPNEEGFDHTAKVAGIRSDRFGVALPTRRLRLSALCNKVQKVDGYFQKAEGEDSLEKSRLSIAWSSPMGLPSVSLLPRFTKLSSSANPRLNSTGGNSLGSEPTSLTLSAFWPIGYRL